MNKKILALVMVFALVFGIMPAIAIGDDGALPVDGTPIVSTEPAVESTPIESAPIESTPIESIPIESIPIESTPASAAPDFNAMTAEELHSYFSENGLGEDAIAEILQQLGEEQLAAYNEYVASLNIGEDPAPVESTPVESAPVESAPIESPPAAPAPVETVDVDALLARIAACQSIQEFWAALHSLTDAEWAALEEISESEEDLAMMREFANGECPGAEPVAEVPETVDYTDAGELMPPVEVETSEEPVIAAELMGFFAKFNKSSAMAELQSVTDDDVNNNGLVLNKTAVPNGDSYKITLEAYATGTVTSTTTAVPVDIVLVLDQSGSMAFDFNGNSANYANSRQKAMKDAVTNFIDSVADKYAAESDHRMAIVTYGSNSNTLIGWTDVNAAGETSLKDRISGLPQSPSGSTNVAAGMTSAKNLMTPEGLTDGEYSYTGSNLTRHKVVIVFTDGVPTTSTNFNTTVATNAINTSKELKDSGATIYTIGIFNGANPSQLYGATDFDHNSDGTVNSYWEAVWGAFEEGEQDAAEIPAGNRFMNYLSSNSLNATSVGLQRSSWNSGFLGYYQHLRFTITDNYSYSNSGYFLTAGNQAALGNIFTNLSNVIGTPSIELGEDAVLKDVISQYFDLLGNPGIAVYTADRTAVGWTVPVTYTGAIVDITGQEVSISGFDFSGNFVSDTLKPDGTYGKKLIIELYVDSDADFLGGNDVPTNTSESGIYDGDDPVELFPEPEVDVPLHYFVGTITPVDSVVCINTSTDLDDRFIFTELDGTNNAYVDVTFTKPDGTQVTVPAGETLSSLTLGYSAPLTNCTDFTLSAVVNPTVAGSYGAFNDGLAATAHVHVLVPTITWTDSTVDAGTEVDLDDSKVSITWTDVNAAHTSVDVTPADDWTVSYSYAVDGNAIDNDYTVNSETGFDVTVTVNGANITQYVNFVRNYDDGVTSHTNHLGSVSAVEFVIHVSNFDLTITKTITGGANPTQSFIFDVTNGSDISLSVALTPADFHGGVASITIYGLPSGDYTVTERGNWSWQYELTSTYELTANNANDTAPFTNRRLTDIFWLGDTYCVSNVYNKRGGDGV